MFTFKRCQKQLKEKFFRERKQLDKINRQETRRYQLKQRDNLLALHEQNDSCELWKAIGKVGNGTEKTIGIT